MSLTAERSTSSRPLPGRLPFRMVPRHGRVSASTIHYTDHMYRARGATRRGQDSSNPLVSHLAHATKVLQLGKAFLNALFATKALMGPGQIHHVNVEAVQSWCGGLALR